MRRRHQTQTLVREISDRSVAASRHRLGEHVASMDAAELRGYLRARVLRSVRQHARQFGAQKGWRTSAIEALVKAALERTIHLLVRELTGNRLVHIESPVGNVRAAA